MVQDTADGTVRMRPESRGSGGGGGGGEGPQFRTVTAADMAAYADESDVPLITAAKGGARPQQPPLRPPSLRAVRAPVCRFACPHGVHVAWSACRRTSEAMPERCAVAP